MTILVTINGHVNGYYPYLLGISMLTSVGYVRIITHQSPNMFQGDTCISLLANLMMDEEENNPSWPAFLIELGCYYQNKPERNLQEPGARLGQELIW
jgi:hypothetical protein